MTEPPATTVAERADQFLEITEPVLEQVGQARRSVPEEGEGVALVGVLGQHGDPDRAGWRRADGVRRLDALHVMSRRHPDIGQRRIRFEPSTASSNSSAVPTAAITSTSPESSSSRRVPSRTR